MKLRTRKTGKRTPSPSAGEETDASVTQTPPRLLAQQDPGSKWKNWWTRFFWTWMMIGGLYGVLWAGHIWVVLLVLGIQIQIFKEVISIAALSRPEHHKTNFTAQSWIFWIAINYFLLGETALSYFKDWIFTKPNLIPLATHHRFLSFCLYIVGFVYFVLHLEKGQYKAQFSQFGWTHMILLFVVCQASFVMNNIFEGLFWFIIPITLVVCNDIMAYVCGFFFGKTPLIQLSPKKTWEGFLGALFCTLLYGFVASGVFARFTYMTCPVSQLSGCVVNPVFRPYSLTISTGWSITLYPVQWHALALALFASLIAPFGGFFASGLKRAVKVKDFGDSIPGHGGYTDRFDCFLMMALFSYIYYHSFIGSTDIMSYSSVLDMILSHLTPDDQVKLYHSLKTYLEVNSLINA